MKLIPTLSWSFGAFALLFAGGFFGNPVLNRVLLCAFCLLACDFGPVRLGLVQKLFLLWLAWTIGCSFFLGTSSDLAFQGFTARMEGLPTWIVLTVLAYAFWSLTDEFVYFALFMGLASIYICLRLDLIHLHETVFAVKVFPLMALAAFTSLVALTFWMIHPVLLTLALPLLMYANRACIVSLSVGILIFHLLRDGKKIFHGKQGAFVASGLVLLMVVTFLSPVGKKFAALDPGTLGQGARTQWITQAGELASRLPITGYGLDSLSRQLKPSTGLMVDKGKTPDRCHNLMYDIILSTGWIGYTLTLFIFGAALGITWQHRDSRNLACFSILCAWIAFNWLNPSGVPANIVMLTALFGIKEGEA